MWHFCIKRFFSKSVGVLTGIGMVDFYIPCRTGIIPNLLPDQPPTSWKMETSLFCFLKI